MRAAHRTGTRPTTQTAAGPRRAGTARTPHSEDARLATESKAAPREGQAAGEEVFPQGDRAGDLHRPVAVGVERRHAGRPTAQEQVFQRVAGVRNSDARILIAVSPQEIATGLFDIQDHGFGFPLLADADRNIARLHGAVAPRNVEGKTFESFLRSASLIDATGAIAAAPYKTDPVAMVPLLQETLVARSGV